MPEPMDILACPACHGALVASGAGLRCQACGAAHRRDAAGVPELLPAGFPDAHPAWRARQDEMAGWYEALRADPARAGATLLDELAPLAPALARLRGRVLDVGGGLGLPRLHLDPSVDYLALEPDARWSDPPWGALSGAVGGLPLPPPTVRGVAERMPFVDGAFDGALALWSLNHVEDPGLALEELARVSRPGATLLLVLEEVEPRWSDLLDPGFDAALRERASWARRKLRAVTGGWPISPDHVPLTEGWLAGALAGRFEVVRRWWTETYLVIEAVRLPA